LKNLTHNKKKIFNDPIYGFISIPNDLVFDVIEHPYFQRLRRIKQLGLTHLVYPGALHTRFHHALGSMHLMGRAIEVIRSKGHDITEEEGLGVTLAILLHDIGHGPFSHSLEYSIVQGVTHEDVSVLIMDSLNREFKNELDLAIRIFRNEHEKKFLHQLVSSQLDMDRLDYLKRDSFYTGVSEGVISTTRIITMLNVKNDELVVDAKGIYSIEKFIIARRLMYWQVYLHKTVISAEKLLINILSRAKELALDGMELFCSPFFRKFLYHNHNADSFRNDPELLNNFCFLDDHDIFLAAKVWQNCEDKVLAILCNNLVNRLLYGIELSDQPFSEEKVDALRKRAKEQLSLNDEEVKYFAFTGSIENNAYNPKSDKIRLLHKDGSTEDIAEAADQLNISVLSAPVQKYFLCFPKQLIV
jgi:HD superfamily phosphohydrolase